MSNIFHAHFGRFSGPLFINMCLSQFGLEKLKKLMQQSVSAIAVKYKIADAHAMCLHFKLL